MPRVVDRHSHSTTGHNQVWQFNVTMAEPIKVVRKGDGNFSFYKGEKKSKSRARSA